MTSARRPDILSVTITVGFRVLMLAAVAAIAGEFFGVAGFTVEQSERGCTIIIAGSLGLAAGALLKSKGRGHE